MVIIWWSFVNVNSKEKRFNELILFSHFQFTSDLFFNVLLPPIILVPFLHSYTMKQLASFQKVTYHILNVPRAVLRQLGGSWQI